MNNIYKSLVLSTMLALNTLACAVELNAGWNLIANNSDSPIVVTTFSDSTKVTSVWKWIATTSKWALYAPSMTAENLSTYAASRGYEVLASISPKDGYWVNAAVGGAVATPQGSTYPTGSELQVGWNLVGGASNQTAAGFVAALNQNLAVTGKQVSTVWTWDAATSKWRFYAPTLAAQGETVLADYRVSKGYAALNTVTALEGVWVNVETIPYNACNVPHHNYGDIATPPEYLGSYTVPTPIRKLPPNIARSIEFKDYAAINTNQFDTPLPAGCTDNVLYGTNLYKETLDRIKADGAQMTTAYSYIVFKDFTADIWELGADPSMDISQMKTIAQESAARGIDLIMTVQWEPWDQAGHSINDHPMLATDAQFNRNLKNIHAWIVKLAEQVQAAGVKNMVLNPNMFGYGAWHSLSGTRMAAYTNELAMAIDDVRKVYTGKIIWDISYYNPTSNAIINKVDVLQTFIGNSTLYGATTPSAVKAALNNELQARFWTYGQDGLSITKPIIWSMFVQSHDNWILTSGTMGVEDGFCQDGDGAPSGINNCSQLSVITDWSLQAMITDATLEFISDQTYAQTYGVVGGAMWLSDDVRPYKFKMGGRDTYALPNLSISVRNKPAEGILRQWFSK